ncbi:hypothetical protein D0Z07_8889 [Hyphodiscus hymeniophilus]|uniref:Uncharacterized protein n=1 Tax=Hyphodiscus hymeniophilus TaxID=353542 RepID=A0A9P6VDM2_9HELO|nr:hypothetical protein D0Z07_8889 [Hyphodiscus hymeniophilus]
MDKTRVTLEINDSIVFATIKGTEPAIAEIGQQLAWLGAALRSSPSDRIAYATPQVICSATTGTDFRLDFRVKEHTTQGFQGNGSCWRSLFRNPVIVEGYPILARVNGEKGLEIPLNMMAGLGQASRVTNFDGGLVIKGHSTILYPTQRIKNSVLWHYMFNYDGSRMSYLVPSVLGEGCASVHEVDTSCLEYSRNFLGWTSSAEIYTGESKHTHIPRCNSRLATADNDVPSTIAAQMISGLALASRQLVFAFEKFSIVAGNYINGGTSFTKGNQDVPVHLSHSRTPYFVKVHHAGNINVVLYDVQDRRGWMVDGASALLHLTRTQLTSSPYSDSEVLKIEEFDHANPRDGSSAAKKTLLSPKNRGLLLSEDWTYQDLVESTYHILEQIQDNQGHCEGQNILYPRVATLKASGRGWVDLIRSINAITLIGKGFGEIIRPAQDSNKLCSYWSHVPTGRDYLVACISTLKEIAYQHGDCESDPLELADGIYWHKTRQDDRSMRLQAWKLESAL